MRRPSGRAALVLLVLVVLGLVFLAWMRTRTFQKPPTPLPSATPKSLLRIGSMGRPAALPTLALGRLLQSQGLSLEVRTFEDPGMMWELLASGELDLVLTTLDQFALAIPRLDPGVLILPSARSQGADVVVARPGSTGPESLAGQRLAYVEGTAGHYLALDLMASQPGKPFQAVPARSPAQAAAWLRNGDVAAAALWEPYVAPLEKEGYRAVWSSEQVPITEVWVASRQVLKGNGVGLEGLEALASAWFDLVQRLRSSPGLAMNAIAEEARQDPAAIQASLERGLSFFTLGEARTMDPRQLVNTLGSLRNDWSLQGAYQPPQAPRPVEPGTTVDLSLLHALALPEGESPSPPPPALEPPPGTPVPTPGAELPSDWESPPGVEPTQAPEPSPVVEPATSPQPPLQGSPVPPQTAAPPPAPQATPARGAQE